MGKILICLSRWEERDIYDKKKKKFEDMTDKERLLYHYKSQVMMEMGMDPDTNLSDLPAKECGRIGGLIARLVEAHKSEDMSTSDKNDI